MISTYHLFFEYVLLESNKYTQLFNIVINIIKKLYNHDLSYMNIQLTKDDFGGYWSNNKVIYINTDLSRVIKHYKLSISEDEFTILIIAHELGHDLFTNKMTINEKTDILNSAKKTNFDTEYLKYIHGKISKKELNEEIICEYIAASVINEYKKSYN